MLFEKKCLTCQMRASGAHSYYYYLKLFRDKGKVFLLHLQKKRQGCRRKAEGGKGEKVQVYNLPPFPRLPRFHPFSPCTLPLSPFTLHPSPCKFFLSLRHKSVCCLIALRETEGRKVRTIQSAALWKAQIGVSLWLA
jgi:hypothetical protein